MSKPCVVLGSFSLPQVQAKNGKVILGELDDSALALYYFHLQRFRTEIAHAIDESMIPIACEQISRMCAQKLLQE